MRDDDLALFLDSFERCISKPQFIDEFYRHFIASSPEVAEKFSKTDFQRQKKALKASLYHMVGGISRGGAALTVLDDVARRHARTQLDIRPELYDLWLASLVHAASRADDRFDAETARVWQEAMAPGIRYLLDAY